MSEAPQYKAHLTEIEMIAEDGDTRTYRIEYVFDGDSFDMQVEADPEGLAMEPGEALSECLDVYSEQELDELGVEDARRWQAAEAADVLLAALADIGLLGDLVEMADDEFGDEDDED